MGSYIEEIIAEFFKIKGYLVSTNYWIPFKTQRERNRNGRKEKYEARSWTDIDVLAIGENELLIVQVKTTINSAQVAEKVNEHFARVENYIKKGKAPDGSSSIKWWNKSKTVKRVLIYEDRNSPPSYLKKIKDKKTDVRYFGDYLKQIFDYINDKDGVKEESNVMRLLHYLNNQNMLLPNNPKL